MRLNTRWLGLVRPGCGPALTGWHLCVLDRGGFRAFALADLLGSKLESANAATPARRYFFRTSGHCRLIGAPGPHQFAIALGTLSSNHKLLRQKWLRARSSISCWGGSSEPRQP